MYDGEKRMSDGEKWLSDGEKRMSDGEKRMSDGEKRMYVNEILLYEAKYSRFGTHYILIFYFKFSSVLAKDSYKGSNSL